MFRRFLIISGVTLALSACATKPSPVPVAQTIAAMPELSTLNSLLNKAGLQATLDGAGAFTVFAPNNEAFKAVSQKTLDELAASPALLKDVLTFHVLASRVTAAEAKTGNAKTVQGANIAVAKAGAFVTVEDAMVQTADVMATNGVVHVVDRVLMPPKR